MYTTFKNYIGVAIQKFFPKRIKSSLSHGVVVAFHWKIMAVSFLSAVVLIFISSFLIYKDISRDEFFTVENKAGTNSVSVTPELLKNTVDYFKNQSATLKQIENGSMVTVDPSR